jgi:hypothetical protein
LQIQIQRGAGIRQEMTPFPNIETFWIAMALFASQIKKLGHSMDLLFKDFSSMF